MTQFYDGIRPAGFPPGITHAALYFDGRYKAPPGAVAPGVQVRWITVIGGAAAAAHTGIIDYEPGNGAYETPGALRAWAAERERMNRRARIYSDKTNAAQALEEVRGIPAIWWIATRDNHPWEPGPLLADLRNNYGADIALADLWANQFTDRLNLYDISNLFTVW